MGRRSRSRRNQMLARSKCVKTLAPLMEEPTAQPYDDEDSAKKYSPWGGLRDWLRNRSVANAGWLIYSNGRSSAGNCPDLKLLLGVLGCPLGPIGVANDPLPHLSIKDVPIDGILPCNAMQTVQVQIPVGVEQPLPVREDV